MPIDQADEVMAHDDNADAESTHDIRRLMQRLPKGTQCAIEAVKPLAVSICPRQPTGL
jgi:RNA polymerase sigma-70 factor (ECF subfamily)